MKKVLILAVVLTFVLSGMAFANVYQSKHDLTTTGADASRDGSISDGTNNGTTNQVCVFCHHPHKTGDSAVEAQLLWNRNNGSATKTYSTYQGTNVTSDAMGTGTDAKHSRVCLSCHDSSYAATVVDTAPAGFIATGAYAEYTITGQADIGNDGGNNPGLQNDHPVDFSYDWVAALTGSEFPATTADADNVQAGANSWKLYNGTMQCGTCHEPHTSTTTAGVMFIRNASNNPLAGSQMCRDCHTQH